MRLCVKSERAIWSACMVFGLTMLTAELIVAHRRAELESIRHETVVQAQAILGKRAQVVSEPKPVSQIPESAALAEIPAPVVVDSGALLVDAVIQVESGGNAEMVGKQGERGLMQVKRGTWAEVTRNLFGRKVSFDHAFDPDMNRQVGGAYLAQLQQFLAKNRSKWHADERSLLLACYNAGPGRVEAAGFNLRGLPESTQDYVKRASALHQHYVEKARTVAEASRYASVVATAKAI